VILCTSAGGHRHAKLGRIAEVAGDASYSTYLVHPLLLMAMATGWDRLPTHMQSPAAFVLLALIVCNVAGYACYRMVERPLSRRLRRLSARQDARDAPRDLPSRACLG
jgi:peptidoglycan/LPS O-acetylase OafA/YrhL